MKSYLFKPNSVKKNNIFEVLNLISIIVMVIPPVFIPFLRYLKYLLPFFSFFIAFSIFTANRSFFYKKNISDQYLKKYFYIYLPIFIITVISIYLNQDEFANRIWSNMYFILAPLITITFFFKFYSNKHYKFIDVFFWFVAGAYLISRINVISNLSYYFNQNILTILFSPAQGIGESELAAVFGMFYLHLE